MRKLSLLLLTLIFLTSYCFAEGDTTFNTSDLPNQIQPLISADTSKNTATLIIMRASGAPGLTGGVLAPIYINGLLHDALLYGYYTSCEAAPGKIKLSCYNTYNYTELILDVSAGETYYINCYMTVTLAVTNPKLELLLDKDIAIEKLKKCVKTSYSKK